MAFASIRPNWPISVSSTSWPRRRTSPELTRRCVRPSVRWGWKGRPSGGKPSSARASSMARCSLASAPVGSSTPTQRTRGRLLLGKQPSPPTESERGPKPRQAPAMAWVISSIREAGTLPRNLRVRWMPSGLTQRTAPGGASALRRFCSSVSPALIESSNSMATKVRICSMAAPLTAML